MSRVYIIAGEASGDFLGSRLLQHLKSSNPAIEFKGIGGKLMQDAGLTSLFPIEKISLMGFFEILPHILGLRKLIKLTIRDIQEYKPSLLITVDSPGFTYRVAKKIRELEPGVKLVHVVAPSVWAYKPRRAEKYATIYDHLLTLLPFEPPYFTKLGLSCTYIGHPILEQNFYSKDSQTVQYPTVCVTAGSRKGEIMRHTPIFVAALNILSQKYHDLRAVFVLASLEHQNLIEPFLKESLFAYSFTTAKLEAYASSDIALAKSGTNTLEIAASKTPMIVAYKVNFWSYLIIRSIIRIKYVSLINIINNQEIIPEFIQANCAAGKISNSLINLLEQPAVATQQVEKSIQTLRALGLNQEPTPSEKAADMILKFV
jgi:lipid-A-disaccharide synthase